MIGYESRSDITLRVNQLECLINALSQPTGPRDSEEITLVVPEKDGRPVGFPCLSHLSLHRDETDEVSPPATVSVLSTAASAGGPKHLVKKAIAIWAAAEAESLHQQQGQHQSGA